MKEMINLFIQQALQCHLWQTIWQLSLCQKFKSYFRNVLESSASSFCQAATPKIETKTKTCCAKAFARISCYFDGI